MSKVYFTILLLLTSCIIQTAFGQAKEKEGIAKAIQAGDSKEIGTYFSDSVDLTLNDVEDVYSKDQAIVILNDFFSTNMPSSFSIKHEGKSKLQDHFYIGDLVAEKNSYRLTFFLKKEGESFKLKQLRIED